MMTFKVIGSIFHGGHKDGDFNWMIKQTKYDDALFVFNDNEGQYILHRDDPTNSGGCSEGAGNGIIRPWQCVTPPRAAGVPTGPNYAKLNPHITQLIDEAVATVAKVATDNNTKRIFFSADSHGHLGTGTFNVGSDVKAYIVKKLKALET
jgi:hypothetical protein